MSLFRHVRVFLDAWSAENKKNKLDRTAWRDTEFLPAALEMTETPPSPIGRAIVWGIMAAAIAALLWSCFSFVDTVAIAEGRLVPEGRLRSVEAAQQGVVRAIRVREGQHVTAGQILIELDPTITDAEASTARTELSTAALTRARDNALLAFAAGRTATLIAPAGAALDALEAEQLLVSSRIAEYQAKLISGSYRKAGAEAAARAADAEISKLRRTLPLLKEALDLQEGLEREGFGAKQRLLQQQQAYYTAVADLEAQIAKLAEARAQVASLASDGVQTRQEFITKAAQERAEAEGVVVTRGNVVTAADTRTGMQLLRAPVTGTIQEITITNIGEVPEVGKPLITIVPDGEPLVVEALLLNKDAGFVRAGMLAAIKLDAYPFTRYGTLKARVERVSPDATVDQQRGLVFPVRLKITDQRLMVDGKQAALSPGMSSSAEIVTGTRRVIEYIWSPVARSLREAGRER